MKVGVGGRRKINKAKGKKPTSTKAKIRELSEKKLHVI